MIVSNHSYLCQQPWYPQETMIFLVLDLPIVFTELGIEQIYEGFSRLEVLEEDYVLDEFG